MRHFFENDVLFIVCTLLVYILAQRLQKKFRIAILNPILISIVVIIVFLCLFKIDYHQYHENVRFIEYFLKPAVVALGLPLFRQLKKIKRQAVYILVAELVGSVIGVVSVVVIAWLMGAPKEVILSLAPKSVTTAIAIEVSQTIGGIPSLTAAVVIIVGIFGAICGYPIMRISGITNPVSQSVSMGTAAHAIGTSKFMEISPGFGAYASLGMISNGVFTAVLTPHIIKLLEIWIGF